MQIVGLTIENIKKLKAVRIVPEGNVIKITGKNEQGKTTVLDAIWWALGGTKDIQEQPLRQGQSEGKIELDLGDMIATRTFSSKTGSTLEIRNKVGSRAPLKSPQAILDALIGKFSFDPLAFAKLGNTADGRKKQAEILLGIVDLKPDLAKLKELSGYEPRVANPDPISVINDAYTFAFEARKVVNRDLTKKQAELEALPKDTVKVDPVVTVELLAEKERMEAINKANQNSRDSLYRKREYIESLNDQIDDLTMKIELLQQELKTKRDERDVCAEEAIKFAETVDKLQDEDLTEITQKINNADDTNRMAERWNKQEKIIQELTEYQQESDHWDKQLKAIKDYKTELIQNAKFPVPGLDFGNGGVLYEGLPFEQASGTARLKVSIAIGMALNPQLRVLQIDEANSIDSEHWKIIEQMAKENDFQIWATLTDESGEVGIVIEDGEVKTKSVEEPLALELQ